MIKLSNEKKVFKIADHRLCGYTNRTRSGSEQVFYTGNDERDFERYRADGGGKGRSVKMYDKPDTIRLKPPEQHYYAKLIDGEWWWVNGCTECNGGERDWTTYIECEEHDVCRTCKNPRKDANSPHWGGKKGWQCNSCKEIQHEIEKQEALDAMPFEYDTWDYHGMDVITCPYCKYETIDSWESADDDEEEHDCPRCDNTFTVTAVHTLAFDCDRIK